MIVVDTSVWVTASRLPEGTVAKTLNSLLEADEVALALPVRLELLAGISKAERPAFRRAFSALPVIVPTEETWQLLDGWVVQAADAGERFTMADLLIAGLADDIGALVWSLDKDFERMARLKFVRAYS